MNLPLTRVHFPDRARERFALPAGVENDGNAAALAEWRLGAGRGASDLIMLTLGTGVGGGLVIDDRLYRGWAELGHVVVVAGASRARATATGAGISSHTRPGLRRTGRLPTLFGPEADAPGSGGARASRRCRRDRRRSPRSAGCSVPRSARSSTSSIRTIVIVGGGFGAAAGDLVLEPARIAARAEAIQPADETLRIVDAELGDEAGMIGAGLVAFEALDGKR